ncbi:hypothetical protein FRY97_07965 [Phaeodactylibacter luteus]|uniref:Uncharacterized protein n=1 Tax=Phaeodactylibacter luteus TaxID=1564516 RepID=A0A5C6RNG4_9BACT|nr:hypothetical protein FRY97_07965 [Phaeodactylibacter luteus]
MLRGSLSARPLALQASGLAFGHPSAALGQCQAKAQKAGTPAAVLAHARGRAPSCCPPACGP